MMITCSKCGKSEDLTLIKIYRYERKSRPNSFGGTRVFIVMPNNRVYIEDMQLHLKSCSKNGSKGISGLVKQFGLTPLPTTNPAP